MTIEAEVGALSGLFNAVSGDLKTCNSSFDLVASRAIKLANQLNTTGDCLVQFADAVQTISDAANKGATRDIGAELTRFCLRQRSLEADVRNLSACLLQFASPLEKRGAEGKNRLGDIERRHRKNLKKIHKKQVTPEVVQEHRIGCSEILLEQRQQFAAFASHLLPVIKAEVRLLEEGVHVKAVEDALESHLHANEPQAIINAVLEDLIDQNGESWQNRLKSPSKSSWAGVKRSGSSSSPSSSSVALSWGGAGSIYGTVSSVSSAARPPVHSSVHSTESGRRLPLSAQTFVAPDSGIAMHDVGKPPLPNRGQMTNGMRGAGDVPESFRRPGRPLSFSGESEMPSDALKSDSASLSEQITQLVDHLNDGIQSFCNEPNGASVPLRPQPNAAHAAAQRHSLEQKTKRPVSIRPPPPYGNQPGPPPAFNNNSALYASARDFARRPAAPNQPSEMIYGNYGGGMLNGQHNDSIDPLPEPPAMHQPPAYQPRPHQPPPMPPAGDFGAGNVIFRNSHQ
ncbi:MTSS1-like protein [Aphelenchoides fujianensis]|nr:MTSS1-like protein [Aphelenchoides fujianensis]